MFVGVCVEFVAAVAWLAELFDDPQQREKVLGYTQAFSSVGGILVAVANVAAASIATSLPAIHGGHEAWRYTLISGVIPALPLIAHPAVPARVAGVGSQARGRPAAGGRASRELFSPGLARTTIVTTLVFAASYGIAFGAIQQLPQILGAPNRGHVEIVGRGAGAAARAGRRRRRPAQGRPPPPEPRLRQVAGQRHRSGRGHGVVLAGDGRPRRPRASSRCSPPGSISRRVAAADLPDPGADLRAAVLLVDLVEPRRRPDSLLWIKIGIFVAGFFTVAQFSFWGNYIPLVFPLHLRGTGESFAANIGGRVIGTAAAWFTLTFSESRPPDPAQDRDRRRHRRRHLRARRAPSPTQWLPEPAPDAVAKEGH